MENILGTNLDRIVILAYFAIVMGFGAYFGKVLKSFKRVLSYCSALKLFITELDGLS